MKQKLKLTRETLFGVLKRNLSKAPDLRSSKAPNFQYSVEQAGMTAFGAFYLQHPSLAAHERALGKEIYQKNFRKLFHKNPIEQVASVRNALDPIVKGLEYPPYGCRILCVKGFKNFEH